MGAVADIFTGGPDIGPAAQIDPAQFAGLTTPNFALNQSSARGGFDLTRRTPGPDFGSIFNQLSGNQAGFLGLLPQIQGLQGTAAGLQDRAAGIAGQIPGLQQQLQGTLPGLKGLFGQVGDIGSRFAGIGQQLSDVQSEIRPGFGRLTEAQLAASRNREAQAAGNLREAMNRRDLGGSSLELQEGRRLELDFGQQQAEIRGDAFTRELQATTQVAGLRAQVLAGEVGSAQEQRAIIADTRATINQAAGLLQLDQQALSQQAQLIGVQLGLTQAQSQIYSQQMANIQVGLQTTVAQITSELQQLEISGNIMNGVVANANALAAAQAQLLTEHAAAQGYLEAQTNAQQLSFIGNMLTLAGGPLAPSSRDFKRDKQSIDTAVLLAAARRMPVERWRYNPEFNDAQSHIGTYAEDFAQAAGIGDGQVINMMDMAGVLLGAIQSLDSQVVRLEAELEMLKNGTS
jgi:hypothetical protein